MLKRCQSFVKNLFPHELANEIEMGTNFVIDDQLMKEALESSGFRTKRAAIETDLRLLPEFSRVTDPQSE